MGRKGKIEIQKIDNVASREVTFAKRKKGLMKKAQELSVLCEAHVSLFIFSDTGRIHEFTSKGNMNELMERYDNKKGHEDPKNPSAEAKVWKSEADNLRQQVEDLNGSLRHLMGEDLLNLRSEELCNLESILDASITMARQRKDQLSKDTMLQLNLQVAEEQGKAGGHVPSVAHASSSSSHNAYATLTELQLMPGVPDERH